MRYDEPCCPRPVEAAIDCHYTQGYRGVSVHPSSGFDREGCSCTYLLPSTRERSSTIIRPVLQPHPCYQQNANMIMPYVAAGSIYCFKTLFDGGFYCCNHWRLLHMLLYLPYHIEIFRSCELSEQDGLMSLGAINISAALLESSAGQPPFLVGLTGAVARV